MTPLSDIELHLVGSFEQLTSDIHSIDAIAGRWKELGNSPHDARIPQGRQVLPL